MPIPQLNLKHAQGWKKTNLPSNRPLSGRIPRRSKPNRGPRRRFGFFSLKRLAVLGAGAAFVLFLAGFVSVAWLSRDLPDPDHLIEREVPENTKIYDRAGENILYEIHGSQSRTLVKLQEIPETVKWATIAIEDKDFYRHKGFSFWAIFRTAVTNVLKGRMAGGSTLTQQFIKNAVLTSEKTYTRKIRELLIAYKMEKRFSKDEILQMYLNEIPYGSTAYGVEAASQRFFGKSVRDVNLAEAAVLAALPQAPTRYSPYGSNRDILISRQHYILDLMVKQGYISDIKAEAAKKYALEFKKPLENITAPHFVMYVKEKLTAKYGEKMVEQGGLKIITTLDLYKQKIAEQAMADHASTTLPKYEAANAALVSLDPKTGQVLAMVGSVDYFNDDIDGQVNIATSLRQPGSSLKPLIYAASFLKGYTPDTVLYDVVTNFSTDPAEPYEPHNYDDQEHGPTTIRSALAGSLNIPAVKAIYLTGVENVLNLAGDFGYTSFSDRSRFGLSLVLGGGEVRLLEHANAYGVFAREGLYRPVSAILKVTDRDGQVLEEFKSEDRQVLDPLVARQINSILSDNAARAYIFGEGNYLTLPNRPVAAKTGTTNDYHDAWTVGYTPSLVTGVWVGNSDNRAMKRGADGSKLAAPIWRDYMKKVLGDTPVENFRTPELVKTGKPVLDGVLGGEKAVLIDRATGLLASSSTPPNYIEEKKFRDDHCILYYVNKDDPRGEIPADPASDPQFKLWEDRVLAWAAKQGFASTTPPTEVDNLHRPENQPSLAVLTPAAGDTISVPQLIVRVDSSAPRGLNRVDYLINGQLLATVSSYPFNLEKNISFLPNGYHTLTVRACDDIDNCTEKKLEINLSLPNGAASREIGLSWLAPANGAALTKIDFPLSLSIRATNHEQMAKINIFYLDASSSPVFVKTIAPVEAETAKAEWTEVPPAGTYKIYGEAVGWSGQSAKTEALVITISQ